MIAYIIVYFAISTSVVYIEHVITMLKNYYVRRKAQMREYNVRRQPCYCLICVKMMRAYSDANLGQLFVLTSL